MSPRMKRQVPRLALNQQEAAEALGLSVDAFEVHVRPYVSYVLAGSRRLYAVNELQRWLDAERLKGGRL
jgi:hypothetical protein